MIARPTSSGHDRHNGHASARRWSMSATNARVTVTLLIVSTTPRSQVSALPSVARSAPPHLNSQPASDSARAHVSRAGSLTLRRSTFSHEAFTAPRAWFQTYQFSSKLRQFPTSSFQFLWAQTDTQTETHILTEWHANRRREQIPASQCTTGAHVMRQNVVTKPGRRHAGVDYLSPLLRV